MKTNLFNTNYSAPEMKVIEVELEGAILGNSGESFGSPTDLTSPDDWNNGKH